MNALPFNTLIPQMIIRQVRMNQTATAAPFVKDASDRIVPFVAETNTATAQGVSALERRDLAPLLRLVSWIFEPAATRKNIRIRVEAPAIGLFANCQEVRIQRILENLLSNALRYAPEYSEVTLAARVENGQICIWVEDQGPGVPVAQQVGLFEDAESSFGELAFGVHDGGSGLAVSRDIVAAHGGEILMYNRVEGGAHFEFRLPSPHATAA